MLTVEDVVTLTGHEDELVRDLAITLLQRPFAELAEILAPHELAIRASARVRRPLPRAILVPSQMLHGDPTAGRVRYEGAPRPGDPSVRALPPAPTSSAYASGAPIVVRPPADASAVAHELAGARPGDPSAR
jgi:hypothetical protein